MATPTGVLFNDPRAKPTSVANLPQPGAYYQYYLTQTLTPAAVYKDGALTAVANQTPGTGDTTLAGDGRLIPIYLNPNTIYRVQLFSALGALLEDTDPYVPPTAISNYPILGSETGVTATQYPYYNVLRYGADPIGVASSLTAFNNAYTSAMAATPHGKILIPAGRYLIPSPGLNWTNPNDIRVQGDGPNQSVLIPSGSNYVLWTISCDVNTGTVGINLNVSDVGVQAAGGFTGVTAMVLADYGWYHLENLELFGSGDGLVLKGMAWGVIDNVQGQTAGTNAAGNTALRLTVDNHGTACGPQVFNGGSFNGQSNVTAGGALWSQKTFSTIFNGTGLIAFGPALTSVVELTNADDITFNEPYGEFSCNTTANTAVWINGGAVAAPVNLKVSGGTIFSGNGSFTLAYAINMVATQALKVENVEFVGFLTAAIKYASLTQASLITIENVVSSGAGNPPVLDASIGGPASGFLKSWHDPWPRLDASLGTAVANVTGDGTPYTVLFDTKNFDTSGNYNTGTGLFTSGSQSGGMYDVSTSVMVNGLTASDTNYQLDILQKTAGGAQVTLHSLSINPGAARNAANQCSLFQSCLLKLSAGDTISVVVTVSGSTKTVGVVGAGTEFTRFNVRYLG